jgi:hypothetical protein
MDGDIDYSNFSRQELEEAASRIDRTQYPKNYENIVAALRLVPEMTPPMEDIRPVSMWPYFVAAFLSAAVMLVLFVFVYVKQWLDPGIFGGLATMLVSAYFSTWLFARRNRRPLLSVELWWLAIGCFLGYWLSGEALKFAYRSPDDAPFTGLDFAKGIAGSIVDLIVILVILRFIVPLGLKRYWTR